MDKEVKRMLDAIKEFQEPHDMTEAEARALNEALSRPASKIEAKRLPSSPRKLEITKDD